MQAPIKREAGVCAQFGRPSLERRDRKVPSSVECVGARVLEASSASRITGRRQVWWSQDGLTCAPMIARRLGSVLNGLDGRDLNGHDLDGSGLRWVEARWHIDSLSVVCLPKAVRESCQVTGHSGDRHRSRRTASPGQRRSGKEKEPQASVGLVLEAGLVARLAALCVPSAKSKQSNKRY